MRAVLSTSVLLVALATTMPAQDSPSSPVSDLIARMRAAVDDFEYAEAIRLGEDAVVLIAQMRPQQLLQFRIVLAAAYYPDDTPQYPEQALRQLDDVVRLQPDAEIPLALRWPGLDSLLNVSRSRVFSSAVRVPAEHALAGTDGQSFLEAIASRPALFRLSVVAGSDGRRVLHDSAGPTTVARLGMRAHSGREPLFVTGAYVLEVAATDAASGETSVRRFALRAEAAALDTVVVPPFDPAVLLPEREAPRRQGMAARSLFFGALTAGIAIAARAEEPIRSSYATDARAFAVGGAMLGASVAAMLLDKGRPLPDNAVANRQARLRHEQAIADATAENRRRVGAYRVTLRVGEEMPR